MYIEYYINNIDDKDIDIKKQLDYIKSSCKVRNVIAPPYHAKLIKKNFATFKVGCFLDYPIAGNDPGSRVDIIRNIFKANIDYAAIVLPFYYLVNRKYDKLRDDIKKNLEASEGKEIRYILEYRKFDHQILTKACEILMIGGISTIYASTGFFIDNLDDNIIACSYLHKKTSINTIINGNCWTDQHISQIVQSDMFGFSSNNLFALKQFNEQ